MFPVLFIDLDILVAADAFRLVDVHPLVTVVLDLPGLVIQNLGVEIFLRMQPDFFLRILVLEAQFVETLALVGL